MENTIHPKRIAAKFEKNNHEKLSGHLLSLSVKNPKGESPLGQLQPVHNDHLLHLPLTPLEVH